jgi:hypothetical protein
MHPRRASRVPSNAPAKGRLPKLEKHLVTLPWQAVREGVDVKLLPQQQEVLAQSRARIHKERAMRRRTFHVRQCAWPEIDAEKACPG